MIHIDSKWKVRENYEASGNKKWTAAVTPLLHKAEVYKTVRSYKGEHYILVTWLIQEEDKMIICICIQTRPVRQITAKSSRTKWRDGFQYNKCGGFQHSTVINGQVIQMENQQNSMEKITLLNKWTQQTFTRHFTAEYTIFSSVHATFSSIDINTWKRIKSP